MKNKFTKYIVISLIVLNGVCLFFLLRPHRGPHHPPKITDVIQFDKSTKSKIDEMEKIHFDQIAVYSKKIKAIRRTIYFGKLQDSDKEDRDAILEEMTENQLEIEKLRFKYFLEIKKLCNQEQQKELDLFVKRMLDHESMRRPKGK